MSQPDNFTCLIPARKGSKGLKLKNLQKVGGFTLIDRAIQLAQSAELPTVLSTDIEDLFEAFTHASVSVRQRPAHLSSDTAPMESVIKDAIENCNLAERDIILLQPTTPFRTTEQLFSCMKQYRETKCSLLLSVTEADPSVLKFYVEQDEVVPINDEKYLFANRQELPKVLKPNGAFYIFRGSSFLANGFDVSKVRTFEMDAASSLDIDNAADLERAQHQAG
jgi:CMP-N-acetylneuraminic acid synthetase